MKQVKAALLAYLLVLMVAFAEAFFRDLEILGATLTLSLIVAFSIVAFCIIRSMRSKTVATLAYCITILPWLAALLVGSLAGSEEAGKSLNLYLLITLLPQVAVGYLILFLSC